MKTKGESWSARRTDQNARWRGRCALNPALLGLCIAVAGCELPTRTTERVVSEPATPEVAEPPAPRVSKPMTPPIAWELRKDARSRVAVTSAESPAGPAVALRHELAPGGYGEIKGPAEPGPASLRPLTFLLKAETPANLEIKREDDDGSVFGCKIPLAGQYGEWTRMVLHESNFEYWWGQGNERLEANESLCFAVAGGGAGTVFLADVGWGTADMKASFPPSGPHLDPDRLLEGVGFRQRRADRMEPEDPLVLEWLKLEQDLSSPERALLPSAEANRAQTFNNALVAMAFILKGERERAERILDFFARSVDRGNDVPNRQNFFLRGEPRGFFQNVLLRATPDAPAYHDVDKSDRWMGDMAWLLLACTYYSMRYDAERYREISDLLESLLVSFYRESGDGPGGYVRHGWREGDVRLHEDHGHPEGNIDCYAVFRLCGRPDLAGEIRIWLDRTMKGSKLPLDLYSWRVLAYGPEAVPLLDTPEFDLRYRKTVDVRGRDVVGFFHGADPDVNNIWLDGTGHMACGYLAYGDRRRGFFYANQMDACLSEKVMGGRTVHVLPYTVNNEGGYEWVRPEEGFVSVGAWYLFAKNNFNPMTIEVRNAAP